MTDEQDIWMAGNFIFLLGVYLYTKANKATMPPSKINDYLAIAFCIGGTGLIAQAAYLNVLQPDGLLVSWRIMQRMPWILKLLRLSAVQRATKGGSLIGLAVLDAAFGIASGVLGFLVLKQRYDAP